MIMTMNNKKISLLIAFTMLACLTLSAQGRKNVRINEVMVQSDTAGAPGWVEFYNSSYGSNAIEKMFITIAPFSEVESIFDSNKGRKKDHLLQELCDSDPGRFYEIPRGDEHNTKIGPRTHFVFEADGDSTAGTFHLPFVFKPGEPNYIAIYDVNGDLVDSVTVPATLPAGQSYAVAGEGRIPTAVSAKHPTQWQMRDGLTKATAITKGNYNTREANENIAKFAEKDPFGILIAVIAMSVVFGALILLYLCFKLFGKITKGDENASQTAAAKAEPAKLAQPAAQGDVQGETIAAICMALYQHLNAHDSESGVITLLPRENSAWGSKTQLLRNLPTKN